MRGRGGKIEWPQQFVLSWFAWCKQPQVPSSYCPYIIHGERAWTHSWRSLNADNFHLSLYFESFLHTAHVPNFCGGLMHRGSASIISAQGLNRCRHLCTACTLWMKIHISRTYWVELQPSVEIKIWRGIPDSVDHWPFPIFMHHRNRKLQELKCHLPWCMYMKFHFELVCASPYSDISEQDKKQMCSEHYQKHFDMLFFSFRFRRYRLCNKKNCGLKFWCLQEGGRCALAIIFGISPVCIHLIQIKLNPYAWLWKL